MKTVKNLGLILSGILSIILSAGCGPDIPEECGQNVKRVVSIDFSGSNEIQATPGYDFEGYDVTVEVEKIDPAKAAMVCYAVRDQDWWIFIDDVLDANIITIRANETKRTMKGHFVLEAQNNDRSICGSGALPGGLQVRGCSGERGPQVYLQPLESEGGNSPIHVIRIVD